MSVPLVLSCISLFLAAWDYRSYADSSNLTAPFLVATLPLSILAFLFSSAPKTRRVFLLFMFWTAFVGFIVLLGLVQRLNLADTARAAGPILLAIGGFFSAYTLFSCVRSPIAAMAIFSTFMLQSSVWRFAYGALFSGSALSEMRWQILSPALHHAFVFGLCLLMFSRRYTLLGLALVLTAVAVAAISVTRSLLGTYCFDVVLILILTLFFRSKLVAGGDRFRVLMRLIFLSLAIVVGIGVAVSLRPDLAITWSGRLWGEKNVTGVETTYLTREAEALELLQRSRDTVAHLVSGNGYGAMYHWHFSYQHEIPGGLTSEYFTKGTYMPGHSTWTYTLFAGGLIGLIFSAGMMVLPILSSFLTLWRGTSDEFDHEANAVAVTVLVAACANLTQTLTSNPLGDRFGGFLIGAFIGVSSYLASRPQEYFDPVLSREIGVQSTATA